MKLQVKLKILRLIFDGPSIGKMLTYYTQPCSFNIKNYTIIYTLHPVFSKIFSLKNKGYTQNEIAKKLKLKNHSETIKRINDDTNFSENYHN